MKSSLERADGFPRALGVSVLLHALCLLGMGERWSLPPSHEPPAQVFRATLRLPPDMASGGTGGERDSSSFPVRSVRTVTSTADLPLPPVLPAPVSPLPTSIAPLIPAPEEALAANGKLPVLLPKEGVSVAGGELRSAPALVPPTSALVRESDPRGPDAAGLRQFRLALASEARRERQYPEVARRAGLGGTAEIRVTVEEASGRRVADLVRSSGHPALDAAALAMLGKAAERTPLPDSLRGRGFTVQFPVVFDIEDESGR